MKDKIIVECGDCHCKHRHCLECGACLCRICLVEHKCGKPINMESCTTCKDESWYNIREVVDDQSNIEGV